MFNPNFEYLCLKNTNLCMKDESLINSTWLVALKGLSARSLSKKIFLKHIFREKWFFFGLIRLFVCSQASSAWFACPRCSVIERSALISSLLTSLVFLGEEQWLLVRKLRNSGQSENLQLPSVSVRKRVLWYPSENSRLLMYNQRTHQPQLLRIAKHCRVKADV